MSKVHVLAIDLEKTCFQECGPGRGGAVLFNRSVSRSSIQQNAFCAASPRVVAVEACATGHYWGPTAYDCEQEVLL